MKSFHLMTDSSCDLSAAMAESLGITVIPMTLTIGNTSYSNTLDWREISPEEVYQKLRTSMPASTSALNVEQFKEAMAPILQSGQDILHLSFSSGLSGTYNFGQMAIKELQAQFPERTIRMVDTLCASMGQGLLVHACAMEQQAGKSIAEVAAFAEEARQRLCHYFTCDTLNRLRLGGRISATSAIFGELLSIKPVLRVDETGHLVPIEKARGRNASIQSLAERVIQNIVAPEKQTIFISHGDCLADVKKLMDKIQAKITVKGFEVNMIGPVIGAHSGPGTIAIFFFGNHR